MSFNNRRIKKTFYIIQARDKLVNKLLESIEQLNYQNEKKMFQQKKVLVCWQVVHDMTTGMIKIQKK